MEGWIKLYRKLTEHWLWEEKPFDKRSAWIDMLMMANHEEKKICLGNELINVERGSFITSELKLMERWGWSKCKVRNFLKMLEEDGMILRKSDKKKTTITIVNYSIYQDSETTERPHEDHKETTERPQKDTNKNDKNDKNDKNIKNIYSDAVKEIFDYYLDTFKGFFKTYTLTKDRKAKIEARLKEGYTVDQIKTAIRNIRQSPFHCGENDRNKFYADISFICRNGSKLEEWINYKPKQQIQTNNVVDYKEAAKSKYGW